MTRTANQTGAATVSGAGSIWTHSDILGVGVSGHGTLEITNGGVVSNSLSRIASLPDSTGAVTVSGTGSTWANSGELRVGDSGEASVMIADGGLVSVAGGLTIDDDGDGDAFINMATGGMLALAGDADDSLGDFLDLIGGSDDIRYWEVSIRDWVDITGATPGEDYTLVYLTEGDLDGYTVLTVTTVPEPATMIVMVFGGLAVLRRRRK